MPSMKKDNNKEKRYFRSLDHLIATDEYKEKTAREFPEGASEMNNDWSRRNFMTLMGASVAMAGIAGCRRPKEKIVPYVKPPEEVIPGVARQYASTMPLGTSAYGIVVESHEGRPTKIEGNKMHPSSNGSSNALIQASILGLYDPDRSQKVLEKGKEKEFADFLTFWAEKYNVYRANNGDGLAVVSESFSSPTMARLKKAFEKVYPKAVWATYEPVSDANIFDGLKIATNKDVRPIYDYSKAKVILSIDSDFTQTESENINANAGFAAGRDLDDEHSEMNRLYMVESAFSSTGASADHRLVLKQKEIDRFVHALADKLGVVSANINLPDASQAWLDPLVEDLLANSGKSLVVAGRRMSAQIHALVCGINDVLKNNGNTVTYTNLTDVSVSHISDLQVLTEKMKTGSVSTLLVLGGDPIYNAPSDLKFASAMKKVETVIHTGLYNDATGKHATWHIPASHYLEYWSDARSADGTVSVVQPLIAPLFDGKSSVEMLNLINSGELLSGHDIVQETWKPMISGEFEKGWKKVLHDGLLANSSLNSESISFKLKNINSPGSGDEDGYEIIFAASPAVYDGRFTNNGWLQELPDTVTRVAWDNVAQVSKKTADKLGFNSEDLITLSVNDAEVQMPLWIVPGTADDVVVVALGYGRKGIGRVAEDAGHDVYPLRTASTMDFASGVTIAGTGRTYEIANVQDHWSMEERPIIREATKDYYEGHPEFAPHAVHHPPLESMWDEFKYDKGYQWGMAIDLTTCTGCNACTIACQSENNIPIIGKEEVRNGREMHWIRVDRYFAGDVDDSSSVEMVHQPVACHHCELAPCEQVCPVAATVHDDEGLNTMVYNRCIGTRYCSNNCPYKVRRFNFFNFTKETPEIVKMAMNPDVTVRSRGVMEKCTYCVQRISKAKIEAKKDDRRIKDGEVVAACQQACPANAIAFGDLMDKESDVVRIKQRNRNYALLGELNVRPRTTYLAKIRNKNKNMPGAQESQTEHHG
ncbi:MAG: 4Fe-4S dicluster domain-containing protein [Calditrichaeota bacterium]|nr:MAG: 4Fe-4S dicluster domain-containing protein [Calditrichota bacterium]